jgi:IS30 family transposase
MTNAKLIEEKRESIQFMITKGYSFTEIAKVISKDRRTIAREILRNRYIKSYHYDMFDQVGIVKAINDCSKLSKPPYVCNPCSKKHACSKHKLYYQSKIAQKQYEHVLKNSREGIDIKPEVIDEIEQIIVPLIKKQKQSINQVYINHSDILFFSKPTFYKYVNLRVLSLSNMDLPKKVRYKQRKKKYEKGHKRKLALLRGRIYDDYLNFIIKHPRMNIIQMDTVEGPKSSSKVLLTIIIKETNFMFIFLLNKQNMACVSDVFNNLKEVLGMKLYAKIFRIVLTDNGSEFFNPKAIEFSYETGRKVCNLFYCDPFSSWQKGVIEKNHQYIRQVFPKGTSFDNITPAIIKRLENNINNIPRASLDNKTPYELTFDLYPELIQKLNCSYIEPDIVNMSKANYK